VNVCSSGRPVSPWPNPRSHISETEKHTYINTPYVTPHTLELFCFLLIPLLFHPQDFRLARLIELEERERTLAATYCCLLPAMPRFVVGNVYAIAAVSVVGGALFGFDISSMSAIISTTAYLCYFNQGPYTLANDGKCSGPTPNVQGGQFSHSPQAASSVYEFCRWHHRFHAWWFMVRIAGLWLPLRLAWPKEVYPDRFRHLVCRFHPSLRFPRHRHVDCRTYHQRLSCRHLLCSSSRLRKCT
jgi:hypothetical protein